jgi:hypothetical protein
VEGLLKPGSGESWITSLNDWIKSGVEWSGDEETSLIAIDAAYRDLLVEIEDLVPKMNGAELDTPIKALQQNASSPNIAN